MSQCKNVFSFLVFVIAMLVVFLLWVMILGAEPVVIDDGSANWSWSPVAGCNGYAVVVKDMQDKIIGYWVISENAYYDFPYARYFDEPKEVQLYVFGCVIDWIDDMNYRILEMASPEVYHFSLLPNTTLTSPTDVTGE